MKCRRFIISTFGFSTIYLFLFAVIACMLPRVAVAQVSVAEPAAAAPSVSTSSYSASSESSSASNEDLWFNLRNGVICFTLFLGGVAGIVAIFLRKRLAGLLFFFACLFLAIDPLAEIICFRISRSSAADYPLSLIYGIASIVGFALGIGCFIGALFSAKGKPLPSTHAAGR